MRKETTAVPHRLDGVAQDRELGARRGPVPPQRRSRLS